MTRHSLDPYPIPREKSPLYINEPRLIDSTIDELLPPIQEPENQNDNIRVYIPLDINKAAVLRRIDCIISRYGEANERNESDFQAEVEAILSQIEIYDQIWFVRDLPPERKHSKQGIDLIKEVIKRLEAIPDGCAEMFPFDMIDRLKEEFLS